MPSVKNIAYSLQTHIIQSCTRSSYGLKEKTNKLRHPACWPTITTTASVFRIVHIQTARVLIELPLQLVVIRISCVGRIPVPVGVRSNL